MSQDRRVVLGLTCLVALLVSSYGPALFDGGQFAHRDAGQDYYPLDRRVQLERDAGRWPLWEAEENGGMPLLGNPTAAVLYPDKVVYALLTLRSGQPILRGGPYRARLRGDGRALEVVGGRRGRVGAGRPELCLRGARS